MWQHSALQKDPVRPGSRLTLPPLPNKNNQLLSRPQLQRNQVQILDNKAVSSISDDFSQIPSVIHDSMGHLRSRHMEVSLWQTRISESISQVDQEIAAVEQMKDVAERVIHEKNMYGKLMSDCEELCCNLRLSSPILEKDLVLSDLEEELQLANDSRKLLQNHICTLLDKISSLQEIRTQLLADYQDKCEAIKLTTKCITHGSNTPSCQLPATQCKPVHVSHNDWLSHCKTLKLTADELIKESSLCRRNVRFYLVHLKSSQEYLHRITHGSLKRRINKLTRVQETLKWERQRIQNEISDLTKETQKVTSQIRNWGSRLHDATHCLEILNQRPRYEHCLDFPYISLTHEREGLTKMAGGFPSALKHAQESLELARTRQVILEDKLAKIARVLQVNLTCYNMHQSFLPALHSAAVLAKKPELHAATGSSSSAHAHLQ